LHANAVLKKQLGTAFASHRGDTISTASPATRRSPTAEAGERIGMKAEWPTSLLDQSRLDRSGLDRSPLGAAL